MEKYNDQEWEPLVLKKKKTHKTSQPSSQLSQEESKSRKLEKDEGIEIKKISEVLRKCFQSKRTQLKLTQKVLAQQCSLDVKVISEIESGKREFNNAEIMKCEKILGKLQRK